MTPARWKYLKQLQPPPARMVWNSGWPKFLGTFNEGRNAFKREIRRKQNELRGIWE